MCLKRYRLIRKYQAIAEDAWQKYRKTRLLMHSKRGYLKPYEALLKYEAAARAINRLKNIS